MLGRLRAPGAAGPALPNARLCPPDCTSHMCTLIPTASNGLAVHAPLHECSLHRVNGRNVSALSTKYATVCLRVWGDSECLASDDDEPTCGLPSQKKIPPRGCGGAGSVLHETATAQRPGSLGCYFLHLPRDAGGEKGSLVRVPKTFPAGHG